jgi:hypothetical protein
LQRDKEKAYPQPLTDGKKAYHLPLPKMEGRKRRKPTPGPSLKGREKKRGKWKGKREDK